MQSFRNNNCQEPRIIITKYLDLWPWFNPYPNGCIRPHSDAILICYELPPLLPPRWFPSLTSPVCTQTTWTSLKPWNLPVQCQSRYALVIHLYRMSKPVSKPMSSFTESVIHTALSSSDSDLFCLSLCPSRKCPRSPLLSVMSSVQSFH